MREVVFFALVPRWFGRLIGIGQPIDDEGDVLAEALPNFLARFCAALIFNGIMQQRRDHFVFRAAVLDDDRRHREQMSDVGNHRAFAGLSRMELMRVHERLIETRREIRASGINVLGHSLLSCFTGFSRRREPWPALAARRELWACRSSCRPVQRPRCRGLAVRRARR